MNDCLANDHADLHDLLGELRTSLDTAEVAVAYARLDRFWARLGVHIRAEHLRLFPAILRALSENPEGQAHDAPSLSQAQSVIDELRRDHDFFMHELARAIATMRDLMATRQDVASALKDVRGRIAAVEERLATHNTIEESQVYLWTESLLSDKEQAELAKLLRRELDNLPRRLAGKTKPG